MRRRSRRYLALGSFSATLGISHTGLSQLRDCHPVRRGGTYLGQVRLLARPAEEVAEIDRQRDAAALAPVDPAAERLLAAGLQLLPGQTGATAPTGR